MYLVSCLPETGCVRGDPYPRSRLQERLLSALSSLPLSSPALHLSSLLLQPAAVGRGSVEVSRPAAAAVLVNHLKTGLQARVAGRRSLITIHRTTQ